MLGKRIAGFWVIALGLLLLIYTGVRTFDFIAMTLPPEKQITGLFALAALDGGVIGWLLYYLKGARGIQRAIAVGMVVVDFIGVVVLFTADTLLVTGNAGMTDALSSDTVFAMVLGLSAVIGINIGAGIAAHIFDPKARREMAEEDALDTIEDTALKQIKDNAPSLAARLAPRLAEDYLDRVEKRFTALMGDGGRGIIDGEIRDAEPKPERTTEAPIISSNGNGHNGGVVFNADVIASGKVRPLKRDGRKAR